MNWSVEEKEQYIKIEAKRIIEELNSVYGSMFELGNIIFEDHNVVKIDVNTKTDIYKAIEWDLVFYNVWGSFLYSKENNDVELCGDIYHISIATSKGSFTIILDYKETKSLSKLNALNELDKIGKNEILVTIETDSVGNIVDFRVQGYKIKSCNRRGRSHFEYIVTKE